MNKKIIFKNLLLGFLSWMIPFAVSFLFYKPGGELMVPYATFKAVIMAVGVISGAYLLIHYFKSVDALYLQQGWVIGLSWFVINILLDSIILIPIMKTSFNEYFMTIGIGYFSIIAMGVAFGYLLQLKLKKP